MSTAAPPSKAGSSTRLRREPGLGVRSTRVARPPVPARAGWQVAVVEQGPRNAVLYAVKVIYNGQEFWGKRWYRSAQEANSAKMALVLALMHSR
jgi:hypothetical protein